LLRSLVFLKLGCLPFLEYLRLEHVLPLSISHWSGDLHRVLESLDVLQSISVQGRIKQETTPFDVCTTSLPSGFNLMSIAHGALYERSRLDRRRNMMLRRRLRVGENMHRLR
jgi:hypothetical protein